MTIFVPRWGWLPGLKRFIRRQIEQELGNGRIKRVEARVGANERVLERLGERLAAMKLELESIGKTLDWIAEEIKELKARGVAPPLPRKPDEEV